MYLLPAYVALSINTSVASGAKYGIDSRAGGRRDWHAIPLSGCRSEPRNHANGAISHEDESDSNSCAKGGLTVQLTRSAESASRRYVSQSWQGTVASLDRVIVGSSVCRTAGILQTGLEVNVGSRPSHQIRGKTQPAGNSLYGRQTLR